MGPQGLLDCMQEVFIMFSFNLKGFFLKYCSKFTAHFIFCNRTFLLCFKRVYDVFYILYGFLGNEDTNFMSLWCDYTTNTIITKSELRIILILTQMLPNCFAKGWKKERKN